MQRIDPDRVIVVAAGRAFERDEALAAIDRAPRGRIGKIDEVGVFRIDAERDEIVAALRDRLCVVSFSEMRSAVVAAIDSAARIVIVKRIGECVDDVRRARRDRPAARRFRSAGGRLGGRDPARSRLRLRSRLARRRMSRRPHRLGASAAAQSEQWRRARRKSRARDADHAARAAQRRPLAGLIAGG